MAPDALGKHCPATNKLSYRGIEYDWWDTSVLLQLCAIVNVSLSEMLKRQQHLFAVLMLQFHDNCS